MKQRDYEKHYRELSDKLGRNREEDMHIVAKWYINQSSLHLTCQEHLEIMELLGFERQVPFDEFSLEEADYVSEVSIKFDSWFKKKWEFLLEEQITKIISDIFDKHIHDGYVVCGHRLLYYAEAMFELAKEIDVLDEFGIKDWQFELDHLRDYIDIQIVRAKERMKWGR